MHDTAFTSSECIQGIVEHIRFHNTENGFCVLRVNVQGYTDLVTIVGNAPYIAKGENIECQGEWYLDKVYGQQFKAQSDIICVLPHTLVGIEKYLGSGLIKGIGPTVAKALINAFGKDVFSVLENEPARLLKLPGIGKKCKKKIIHSWAEQESIRSVMLFLQSYGISTTKAVRIYKNYGKAAIVKIRENPYRLAFEISGIGFKIIDDLAMRLGFDKDSIQRAQAGVHYVLQEHCHQGHCAMHYQYLVEASVSLLRMNETIIKAAIDREIAAAQFISDKVDNVRCIFPTCLHQAETAVVKKLLELQQGFLPWGELDVVKTTPWVEKKTGLKLENSQKQAIEMVFKHKVSIITGGPGVGKTTIVHSILKMIQAKLLSMMLCAPTGRAAKRLTETTGLVAKTIHRLLGFNPETRAFKHDQNNPLSLDVLIVDEASMLDVILLHHLLKAIPDHAALIFVGDVDQLPSVGSGAVLMDMIRSQIIPTARLKEIFRQAANSNIIVNAHRINIGELPLPNESSDSDFYIIYAESLKEIQRQLMELVSDRLPQFLACHPMTDIQVLTPMNRGELGTLALNIALQKKLNGHAEPKVTRHGFVFSPGDKVIQTVNNYHKEIFNGDIGFISHIDLEKNTLKVIFDYKTIDYDFSDLHELNLAYAISIHKSQGSEFPVVLLLLSTQHHLLLARNLLYTGVTRGKRLVVLLGQRKAIKTAVKNNKENKRLTKLSQRLQEESSFLNS